VKFLTTELPGVILIEPDLHGDVRGFFLETYHERKYSQAGIRATFVQDNHSRSSRGTLRGLHHQTAHPQAKLVRVVEGEVYDVVVDIRRGSPTFGKHAGFALSARSFQQLYIPPNFAHGFCVTSDAAQVEYKCTEFYDPAGELAVAWNDPDLAIAWPVASPKLSEKDAGASPLRELTDRLPIYDPASD